MVAAANGLKSIELDPAFGSEIGDFNAIDNSAKEIFVACQEQN